MCPLIELLLWTTTAGPFVVVYVTFVFHADKAALKVTEKPGEGKTMNDRARK